MPCPADAAAAGAPPPLFDAASFSLSRAALASRRAQEKMVRSISKTQRVLRMALVWAQEKGWIEKAPLPEQTATH